MAEWEAVRQSMGDSLVAWEWLRLLLKDCHKASLRVALEQDGDASARAKGAVAAYEVVSNALSEMRKETEDGNDE